MSYQENFKAEYINADFKSGYPEKRDCFDTVRNYVTDKNKQSKICALYGIRRTGKTVLMQQVIESLSDEDKSKTVLITCNKDTDVHDVISFVNGAIKKDYKYFFIDEITYAKDFQAIGEIFSDNFVNFHNARVVVTGTDSLGLSLPSHSILYDRVLFVPTTFTTYPEYSRIMNCNSFDEYIVRGTTFYPQTYENIETTRKYVETSIIENLISSLERSEGIRSYPPVLTELYEARDIENAVLLAINNYNRQFITKSLKATFESKIFSDEIDVNDKSLINNNFSKLMKVVETESIKTNLSEYYLEKVNKLLSEMDILKIIPVVSNFNDREISEPMKIIAHPGMYHANLKYTLEELRENANWVPGTSDDQKNFLIKKVYEVAVGDLMENFIIANVNEILNKSKIVTKTDLFMESSGRWFVSKYEMKDSQKRSHESDLIIFDKQKKETFLFEIKHSAKVVKEQSAHLESNPFLEYIESKFGKIKERIVLYNGKSDVSLKVPRVNISDFLQDMYKYSKNKEYSIGETTRRLISWVKKENDRGR
jgi:predicted AAA+ superfamily ATPase